MLSSLWRHKGIVAIIFTLVSTVLLGLTLFGFARSGSFFTVLSLFSWIAGWLNENLGIHIWLSRSLSALSVLPVYYIFKAMFSGDAKNRTIGLICFLLVSAIASFGIFQMTQDWNFDRESGEATKWYAKTPQGCQYFDAPGFDPKYGVELKPVTSETLRKCKEWKASDSFDQQSGQATKWYSQTVQGCRYFDAPGYDPDYGTELKPVTPEILKDCKAWQQSDSIVGTQETKEGPFFNTVTGEPLMWYYRDEDGSIDLFSHPGYHPRYKAELQPIIPEVVRELEKAAEAPPEPETEVNTASADTVPNGGRLDELSEILIGDTHVVLSIANYRADARRRGLEKVGCQSFFHDRDGGERFCDGVGIGIKDINPVPAYRGLANGDWVIIKVQELAPRKIEEMLITVYNCAGPAGVKYRTTCPNLQIYGMKGKIQIFFDEQLHFAQPAWSDQQFPATLRIIFKDPPEARYLKLLAVGGEWQMFVTEVELYATAL